MRDKGQNLIEFAIIIALVVVGGVVVLTMLGGNINNMFAKSQTKYKGYKPFGVAYAANNTTSSKDMFSVNSTTSSGDLNINGTPITINTDGSVSFQYEGQEVTLTANTLNNMNEVLDTAGTAGTEKIVQMVQAMIDEHKSEYEPADVPIDIIFGKSARTDKDGDEYAYGEANVNLVAIKVGEDFKVLQNDTGGKLAGSQYMIEGNTSNSTANITDENGNKVNVNGFSDNNESTLNNIQTYTDPATGKFYIIGEGNDSPHGSGQNVLTAAGITVPSGLIEKASNCFDKDGRLVDQVWLLEFDPNK